MPVFNYPKKEVNVKVVYYGPGLSGKTTNLQKIHDGIKPDFRGKLISLATQTDRTLFFDFMPMDLGSLGGYKIRLHLYTVPGQVHYNATRKLVLKGVDGVVFVADSQKAMNDANVESVLNLEKNLQSYGKSLAGIPHVIQANKRDLGEIVSMEEIDSLLNHHGAIVTEAAASEGQGVLETLTEIVRLVMKELREQFSSGSPPRTEPSTRPAHEPAGTPEIQESEAPESEPVKAPVKDTQPLEEVELMPEKAPVSDAEIEPVSEPDPGQDTLPDKGKDIEPDTQSGMEEGTPLTVLVPLEDLGTLELSFNIKARVLKKGDMRSVDVDVAGAAIYGSEDASKSLQQPLSRGASDSEGDSLQGQIQGAGPAAPPEQGTVKTDNGNEPGTAETVNLAPVHEIELEPEPEPLAHQELADDSRTETRDLPPLADHMEQPLGAPLDGEEAEEMDLPPLPQEEEKILLDEDLEPSSVPPQSPPPSTEYDPSVQSMDFDFPETGPEDEEPRKRGLFGRLKKK